MVAALCLAPFRRSRVTIESPLRAVSAFSTTGVSAFPLKTANPEKDPIKFEIRSCSPPRFDTFGDLLVGKWAIETTTIDGATTSNAFVAEVEEVMRSCGGAVQGIREPAATGKSSGEEATSSTYLNRANDGFVFFDDGCYTMGPISIEQGMGEMGGDDFLTCLVLSEKDPEGRTQRLVFEFGDANEQIYKGNGMLSADITLRTKQRFGDTSLSANDDKSETTTKPNGCVIEEITRIVRCRMPSEGQPWMLQRAKWETLAPVGVQGEDDEGKQSTSGAETSTSSTEPLVWASAESAQEFYKRLGTSASNMKDSSVGGIMVLTAVACPKSNTLRLLARHYQSSADSSKESATLSAILRVEATISFDC